MFILPDTNNPKLPKLLVPAVVRLLPGGPRCLMLRHPTATGTHPAGWQLAKHVVAQLTIGLGL